MKHLHVPCAIIELDGFVLAAHRSTTMSLPLKFEFPCGKVDSGETPYEYLKRELVPERGVRVCVGENLPASTYQYLDFTVMLYPSLCSIEPGDIVLYEHSAMNWLPQRELHTLDWGGDDLPVIETYLLE
jgi:8-oxo-dGTP diphosphatase